LSSVGQLNHALSPLAGSGGLSQGFSISAPLKSVPKTFQPSATGFFEADLFSDDDGPRLVFMA